MVLSMTGYGRIEEKHPDFDLIVEVKSLNSRYLDINTKLHDSIYRYENDIISLVRKKCIRGKVYVLVSINYNNHNALIKLDRNRLKIAMKEIEELKKISKIDENISLEYLLRIPDLFQQKQVAQSLKNKKKILKCIDNTIDKMMTHRKKDGKMLQKDILSKVKKINRDLKKIVRLSSSNISEELKNIKNKLNKLISNVDLDNNRLYQEVALIMEKKDINEELSRFEGHMKLLDEYIYDQNVSGKKINFLLQEINREVNTIGSKIDNISIKHTVVDIKNNVEQIREQAQNIL